MEHGASTWAGTRAVAAWKTHLTLTDDAGTRMRAAEEIRRWAGRSCTQPERDEAELIASFLAETVTRTVEQTSDLEVEFRL